MELVIPGSAAGLATDCTTGPGPMKLSWNEPNMVSEVDHLFMCCYKWKTNVYLLLFTG